MPTIIDRYMLRQFIQVLIICLLSLIGLYIVIDAFSHLDHFIDYAGKHGNLLKIMGEYYAYRGDRVLRPHQRRAHAHRRDVHGHLDPAAPRNDGAPGGRNLSHARACGPC